VGAAVQIRDREIYDLVKEIPAEPAVEAPAEPEAEPEAESFDFGWDLSEGGEVDAPIFPESEEEAASSENVAFPEVEAPAENTA
jgi:hypothetical protein